MLFIIIGILVILVIAILFSGYKKAPAGYGFHHFRYEKEDHHRQGQRENSVSGTDGQAEPEADRHLDVKTTNAVPTADYINIQVDAAVNVKISSDPPKLALAAENFLNQNTQYIANIAREVLEGKYA